MPYLLDANVFIQAKNLYYGFDFCPAFWDWLAKNNQLQKVFSIDRVLDELKAGDDELSVWAQKQGEKFFVKPDQSILPVLGKVSNWATSQKYEPVAVNTFLQVADYYLVVQALSKNFTLITHEVASDTTKKIKLPNICIGLGIKFMSPYQMLRHENALFILGHKE